MNNRIVNCDCGARLRLPDELQAQSVRCPRCKQSIELTADSLVRSSVAPPVGHEAICPICQTPMVAGESCVTCPGCDQAHHQECWSEVGGCGTYGCQEAPKVDKSETTLATPLTAWGDTKKCPACGEVIKAIALKCRYCSTEFSSVDPMSAADLRRQAKASDDMERLKKWVISLFVASIIGCMAPIVLIVSAAFLLPKRAKIQQCGPVFVIMSWTSIGLSGFYAVLLVIFLLIHEF